MQSSSTNETTGGETADTRALKDLVAWSRANGLELLAVSVGSARVEMAVRVGTPVIPDAPKTTSLYEQYGGELMTDDVRRAHGGDELVPAVTG